MSRNLLREWTVDYGEGPRPCTVPHAWRQDVDVRWEGPAVYRTALDVPKGQSWLLFHGVSYEAKVFVEDKLLGEHRGIWDAFSIDVSRFARRAVELRVEVVKNGGKAFPVKEVLSGFLPYVFNTFGGIYQDVELVESPDDPVPSHIPHPASRIRVRETKLFVDGKPFYLRAPLTWGWYPELGHTNPPEEEIRREVRLAKEMGFNTMKFCLWVPPHRYFEILNGEGMFAWLELPLWDPSPSTEHQEPMFAEMERIVRQYARHDNIIVWTCGCELSSNTTAEFRERLYKMVKGITGCPLVKDNSGGSEMYGGDLREFGDFYDFHPYCDLPFYPQVLDSLLIGPRKKMPILLGEFNDVDVFRDLARLKKERPYWTSSDPALNDQGVRWEPPVLPRVLEECRPIAVDQSFDLYGGVLGSTLKAHYMRRSVQERVRSREDIAGYVVTGWRDTPVSSAGFLDDWGMVRGESLECAFTHWTREWNGSSAFFLVPFRRPPWVHGGNRPGWIDPHNHLIGPMQIQVGLHTERRCSRKLQWNIHWHKPHIESRFCFLLEQLASGEVEVSSRPGEPNTVLTLDWTPEDSRDYYLEIQMGRHRQSWRLNIFSPPNLDVFSRFGVHDPKGVLAGAPFGAGPGLSLTALSPSHVEGLRDGFHLVFLATDEATVPAPFWREAAYQFDLPSQLSWLDCNWEALLAVSPDRVIDLDALYSHLPKKSEIKVLINRIDTRTYKEAPIMVEVRCGKGRMLATTLRPYGGLGCQPYGVMNNPAGAALLESMMRYLESDEGGAMGDER